MPQGVRAIEMIPVIAHGTEEAAHNNNMEDMTLLAGKFSSSSSLTTPPGGGGGGVVLSNPEVIASGTWISHPNGHGMRGRVRRHLTPRRRVGILLCALVTLLAAVAANSLEALLTV